jgi:HEPN domain-containing protein
MGDRENALLMLGLAREDSAVLRALRDRADVSDRAFGFHSQQAVEKALKAWLALAGTDYPKIHDLEELLALLSEKGQKVPEAFQRLEYLTAFAVQFRYATAEDMGEPLDRAALEEQVSQLVDHVTRLLASERGA